MLKEASAAKENILAQAEIKAREETARMISEAKAQIESEKQSAIADIRQQVATLSVSIAEKVLRKNLASDKEQMDYVDNLLNDLSSKDNK